MSEDKITDDDIAALPQAAQGEIDRVNRVNAEKEAAKPPQEKAAEAQPAFDQEFETNSASLVQEGLAKTYTAVFNEPLTQEQTWAMSKASGLLFATLRKVRFGAVIGGALVVSCLLAPFVPNIMKKIQAMKQPKPEAQNG